MMVCFVLFNRVITDQYYLWIFNAIILALPEVDYFKQKQYGLLFGFMCKIFLMCVPSMVLWGLFKAKF